MTKTTDTKNLFDSAKKVADDAIETGRKMYLAGLGVYATAEEETKGFFDRMVDKGKGYNETRTDYVKLATDKAREFGRGVEDRVQTTVSSGLHRVGVPSRDEIRTLINRVEKLTKKVESMNVAQ